MEPLFIGHRSEYSSPLPRGSLNSHHCFFAWVGSKLPSYPSPMTDLKTGFFLFSFSKQGAKRVMSDKYADGPDFAIGLVNFVVNLHDGQVKFFEVFKLEKNCTVNPAH